jgi:peptidoglycan-associated lipoprotein
MKTKRWINFILIAFSVFMLAACSTKHKQDQSAINDANAAYNDSAQASGLGDNAGFGDQAANGRQTAQRIYYFDFDSNIVHESDKPAIAAQANYLLAHPQVAATLEGHTDPRGSREYNIGLGERRAKAVANILVAKGVNPGQIHIVSYGAEKLAVPGRTESDYQKDRRVVLVYYR